MAATIKMPDTKKSPRLDNLHGSLVQIDRKGVLITGKSGSGKTSLALGLIETASGDGKTAFLVSHDQVLISTTGDCVMEAAPTSIAGKIEIYGFGIVPREHISSSQIHLIVKLVDDRILERMPEPITQTIGQCVLPLICAPERHENLAVRIVMAKLRSLFD